MSGLSCSYDATAPEGERIAGVAPPSGEPLAEGGGGCGAFAEGETARASAATVYIIRHAGSIPRSFSAPGPAAEDCISGG